MAHTAAPPICTTRHVVILAAGESKRTRPLTAHRPKPLIPLLGRPLLAHILDELAGLVDRATLVVGYRAEMIEACFGDRYRDISLRYVRQTVVNGTAGALLAAAPIDEPFFLLYGDNLIARADVLGVCDERYKLAGLPVEDARSFGVLDIVDGRVRGVLEKPANPPPNALANPGIFHLDQAAFPALERIRPSPRGELELTDLIGLLAEDHPVGHHVCVGHWMPVGTPWEALSAAQFLLARRAGLRMQISPRAALDPSAQLAGAVTIGSARIEAGARIIGPTVIGDGCVIGAGSVITRSALEPGAVIGSNCTVTDSVIGAGAHVDDSAAVESAWLDDGAVVGAEASLRAETFADLRSTAATTGLLTPAQLATRGAILAAGVRVRPWGTVGAGAVIQ